MFAGGASGVGRFRLYSFFCWSDKNNSVRIDARASNPMTATFCLLRGLLVGAAGVEGVDGAAAGAARAPAAAATAGRDERAGGIARERTRRQCSKRDRGATKAAIDFAGFVVVPDHGEMSGWGGGREM